MTSPLSPPPLEGWFPGNLERARRGDTAALDRLFRRFYPVVQDMVHRKLARDFASTRAWLTARFSTGDVVQEVFRSVLLDLRSFRGTTERDFARYLAMVVRNRILDVVRHHQAARRDGRRTSLVSTALPDIREEQGAGELSALSEYAEQLRRALREFPERERLLLRARIEDQETFQNLPVRQALQRAEGLSLLHARAPSLGELAGATLQNRYGPTGRIGSGAILCVSEFGRTAELMTQDLGTHAPALSNILPGCVPVVHAMPGCL